MNARRRTSAGKRPATGARPRTSGAQPRTRQASQSQPRMRQAASASPARPSTGDPLAARLRRDRRLLLIAVGLVAALIIGGGVGLQAWRTQRDPVAPARATVAAPVTLRLGEPLVFGDPAAPVTLRLYEDFHCRHCADFEEKFGSTLDAALGNGTAAVHFYPMAFVDPGSFRAAAALGCAAEAGFGRPFSDGLFANPRLDWRTEQLLALGAAVVPLPAGAPAAGAEAVAPADFTACVRGDRHRAWVDSINATADSAGVTQTPALFLNDQPMDITALEPAGLARSIAEAAAS